MYINEKELEELIAVLPREHKAIADEIIESVREKDAEAMRTGGFFSPSLELRHQIERKTLPLTVTLPVDKLNDGARYGIFEYSPRATAFRNGKQCAYHGDVYITMWTVNSANRKLYCKTAWDGLCELTFGQLIREHNLLIEL